MIKIPGRPDIVISSSYPHLSVAKHYHLPYRVVLLVADVLKEGRYATPHHLDATAHLVDKYTTSKREEIIKLIDAIHKEVFG